MVRVVQISECFPTNYKPLTGEFILRHAESLSEKCDVKVIVPLRFVPPREAIFSGVSGLFSWFRQNKNTEGYVRGRLTVEYMNYISLPRPRFESIDENFINTLFRQKLKDRISSFAPDIVYCHWLRPWAGIAAGISEELGLPFVLDHHEDLPTLKRLFPDDYEQFLKPLLQANNIIVHSKANLNDLKSELPSLKNIELVHLGQNFDVAAENKSFSEDLLRLICVSHMHEERKNIDVLIKALYLIKDKLSFSLNVLGDGLLRNRYVSLVQELGLADRIFFEGPKTQDEIKTSLDAADIFILPSFPEAFGIVFAEALARGLPVITCKGNGGGEELKHLGYPSVLAEPLSSEDLSNNILNLANDVEQMKLMSSKGKEIVKANFTYEANSSRTIEVLTETISKFKREKIVRD